MENTVELTCFFEKKGDYEDFIALCGDSIVVKKTIRQVYPEDFCCYVRFLAPNYSELLKGHPIFPEGFYEKGIVDIICDYLPFNCDEIVKIN